MAPPAKTWSSAACTGVSRKHTPTVKVTATSQVFFMTVLHRGALLATHLPASIRYFFHDLYHSRTTAAMSESSPASNTPDPECISLPCWDHLFDCGRLDEMCRLRTGAMRVVGLSSGPGNSLDHIVGNQQELARNRKAQLSRSLQIDDKLECGGLLHRQLRRVGPFDVFRLDRKRTASPEPCPAFLRQCLAPSTYSITSSAPLIFMAANKTSFKPGQSSNPDRPKGQAEALRRLMPLRRK
jgi:hypothetical protein